MLSYRHAFHAGNPADVLKHVVLVELLRYLAAKDKPLWYVDTHAGAGMHALDAGPAAQAGEYRDGIARLLDTGELPDAAGRLRELVARCNPPGELRRYPGSPWFAQALLRETDRLWLHELHPADHAALAAGFAADPRIRIAQRDGLAALRALLPPQPRRALVFLDPSYEVKDDYRAVVAALEDALGRFATGVYAAWYPLLQRREAQSLPAALERIAGPRWLRASLSVRRADDRGMYGSGIFVINPPHTLPGELEATLPGLAALLSQGDGAGFELDCRIP